MSELRWGTSIIPPRSAPAELAAPGGDAARPASAMPTCPWVLPTVQLALLLAVEAVEVAPAAAVDEGPAFGDSLVVVPPQRVVLAVPLVQRQAAGLSCGVQTAMVRAGGSRQHTGDGGSRTHLAEEEKRQKGKAVDGSQLSAGRVWLEGTSLPCPSAGSESRRRCSGQALSQGQPSAKAGGRAGRQAAQGHDGHGVPWKGTSGTLCMLLAAARASLLSWGLCDPLLQLVTRSTGKLPGAAGPTSPANHPSLLAMASARGMEHEDCAACMAVL